MSISYVEELKRIESTGQLNDDNVARATGVAQGTVGSWRRGNKNPTGARRERLLELSSIVERLCLVMKPSYIPLWLTKPVAMLNFEKPLDVIAQGRYIEVAKIVSALESPMGS